LNWIHYKGSSMISTEEQKSCATCKYNIDGWCALDAEKVCFKPDDWYKNEPYEPTEYTCWEAKHFNDQKGETK